LNFGIAMAELREILRARRVELGQTLTAVAAAAGISKAYLSMIENGKVAHPPARAVLLALARALDIDAGALHAAADLHNTPPAVRAELADLTDLARRGHDLAAMLTPLLSRRRATGPANPHAPAANRVVLAGPALRQLRACADQVLRAPRPPETT
jgi:transcriptional regulator with XRE-family HTH domain